jgi:hypothetical protein
VVERIAKQRGIIGSQPAELALRRWPASKRGRGRVVGLRDRGARSLPTGLSRSERGWGPVGAPSHDHPRYLLLMTLIAIELAFAGWIAWLLV